MDNRNPIEMWRIQSKSKLIHWYLLFILHCCRFSSWHGLTWESMMCYDIAMEWRGSWWCCSPSSGRASAQCVRRQPGRRTRSCCGCWANGQRQHRHRRDDHQPLQRLLRQRRRGGDGWPPRTMCSACHVMESPGIISSIGQVRRGFEWSENDWQVVQSAVGLSAIS